jgi:hypothetical protein
MGGRHITRAELAEALKAAVCLLDPSAKDPTGLGPFARQALQRAYAEGLVPRSWSDEDRALIRAASADIESERADSSPVSPVGVEEGAKMIATPQQLSIEYVLNLVRMLHHALRDDDRATVTTAVTSLRDALKVACDHESTTPDQHTVFRWLIAALGAKGSAGLIPASKHELMEAYAKLVVRAFDRRLIPADVRAIQETLRADIGGSLVRTPLVHIMISGSALCGKLGKPGQWGDGDSWVRLEQRTGANCATCLDRVGKLGPLPLCPADPATPSD